MPPFEASEDGTWRAVLPRATRFARKTAVTVGPLGFDIGRTDRIAYNDIVTVQLKAPQPSSLQFGSADFRLTLTTAQGAKVKLAFGGLTKRQKAVATATAGYMWSLMSQVVAPRRHREIADELRAGGAIEIGGLTLASDGVTKRRAQSVAWANVHGPVDVGPQFIGFKVGEDGAAVAIDAKDAYLLPALIPYLRALFS